MAALECPYCQNSADLVNGNAIYPHRPDLDHKLFWLCSPCNAYVGCHPGTSNPLGRLANAELRQWKMAANRWFDPIWRDGSMTRRKAYSWLAGHLGLAVKKTHIGLFDVETCQRVIQACREKRGAE